MSDLTTLEIFTDAQKNINAANMNGIVARAKVQPDIIASKPASASMDVADQFLVLKTDNTLARSRFDTFVNSTASVLTLAGTSQNGMLRQVSGVYTDYVDGTNNCRPLAQQALTPAGGDFTLTAASGIVLRQNSSTSGSYCLQLIMHSGITANAVYTAPLLIDGTLSGSRPMISFNIPGTAINGLLFNSDSHFYRQDAAGALYNLIEGESGTGFNNRVRLYNDNGLDANSWNRAALIVQTPTTAGRAGIGFYTSAVGAIFLYLSTDHKLHFMDSGGTDHIITSS